MIDIRGLAYIVAESSDTARWKAYAEGVLGMMSASAEGGALYLKMDERQFRILVLPGTRDAYTASGWEVLDEAAFDAGLATLKASGTPFELGDAKLAALRRVQHIALFNDPSGNRHELVYGFQSDFAHFASPAGVKRFIASA